MQASWSTAVSLRIPALRGSWTVTPVPSVRMVGASAAGGSSVVSPFPRSRSSGPLNSMSTLLPRSVGPGTVRSTATRDPSSTK
ncbi:hypothetical protein ACFQ2H_03265 [Streptomyces violaceoruber]